MAKSEPTFEEIVAQGVKENALIDKHLTLALKAAERNVSKVVIPAIEGGMFGKALEAKLMLAHARSLVGLIAQAAAAGAELHIAETAIAVANNVDLGSVTTVGGVTVGGFHVEGGGR